MSKQKFPFYFTSDVNRTYKIHSYDKPNNVEFICSTEDSDKQYIGTFYTENKRAIKSYVDVNIIFESSEKSEIGCSAKLENAHDYIRDVLNLKEDEPKRFDYYAEVIDNLVGAKMCAELDRDWDHLDLMSLVKYLQSTGLTISEIKTIARDWQK